MVPKSNNAWSMTAPKGIRVGSTALVVGVLVSLSSGVAESNSSLHSLSWGQAYGTTGAVPINHEWLPEGSAIRLAQLTTGGQESERHASVLAKVRQLIATYFGVPVEDVTEATDLAKDLYADPMDAIEVLARLCDRFNVPFPNRDDLTSVGALVLYIEWAERNAATGQDGKLVTRERRGTKRTEPGSRAHDGSDPATEDGIYRQTVFFGTDRRPTGRDDPNHMFSGDRGSAEGLTYGIAEVSIPVAVHKKGQMERPDLFKLEFEEDPKRHIVLQRVEPLGREAFFSTLNDSLERSAKDHPAGGDAFIFIHGFNVPFERAARRTAQIMYDLEFPGASILYSWPSDGRLLSYLSDREDAEWSAPHLEAFLNDLHAMGNTKRLHLIAHSMGNQVLIRALGAIAINRAEASEPLFSNVILAAPDFDAGAFTDHFASRIRALSEQWTIYASDKDRALDASQMLSVPRLGTPLTLAEGMDTVDASGIDVTPWSVPEFHSYYANKKHVIADLIAVLRGLPPEERSLVQRTLSGRRYWVLSELR